MQLTNPVWIHHSGGAIYSIDIHPNGTKIATCGQGDKGGSGLVMIWNMKPVNDEKASQDRSCDRLLSRLTHQTTNAFFDCVNCVRWSIDGKYLGCAGDQQSLTIWELSGRVKSAGTIGSLESANVEKYREKFRLYGHSLDVLHLEWSKDCRYLASCGMDHSVIIWDATNFPNKIITLDIEKGGHGGIVKGLSWDPIGKFLASQSADKSIKIWTIDNWQCIKTITKPFVESSQSTMFCRLDWTPDGAYLIAPCASNNSGPTAHLIRRKDWDTSLDLVGHRKAITVVRSCPLLLEYVNHKGMRFNVSCIAMGSRDKSLSVWLLPNVDRPLVVLHKLFKHSVLDFSWNNYHLIVCSMDGTVKSAFFDPKELGRLLSKTEMGDVCERLYSRRPSQYTFGSTSIENQANKRDNTKTFVDDLRIMVSEQELQKNNMENLSVVVPKNGSVLKENGDSTQQDCAANIVAEVSRVPNQPPKIVINVPSTAAQTEGRTESGKRRIQPAFLAPVLVSEAESGHTPAVEENRSYNSTQPSSVHVPPLSFHASGSNTSVQNTKQSSISNFGHLEQLPASNKQDTQALPVIVAKPSLRMAPEIDLITVNITDGRSAVLPVPKQQRQLLMNIPMANICTVEKVEILNEFEIAPTLSITRISGFKHDKIIWQSHIDPVVCTVSANNICTVVGCYDHTLYLLSTQSGRLQTRLVIDSVPSLMSVHKSFVSVCSSNGLVYSWDVNSMKCLISRQSIADVCAKKTSIVAHSLTETGMPVITLSTGKTFTYSCLMNCWQLLQDEESILSRITLSTSASLNAPHSSRTFSTQRAPIHVESTIQQSAICAVLEQQISSALSTQSSNQFRHCLYLYVQYLVRNGCATKLGELLTAFFNDDTVCGLKTDALLLEVLELITVNESKFSEVVTEMRLRLNRSSS